MAGKKAQDFLALAQEHYREGHLADSESAYRQAIKADDQLAEAFYGLGLIRHSMRDYSGAQELFHECLHRNPSHEHCLYYLGSIAEQDGHPVTATGLYGKVLSLNPEHKSARARLTQLLIPPDRVETPALPGARVDLPNGEREWRDSIVGRVTGFKHRTEDSLQIQVFDIRLQAYDDNGRETREYAAMMRGRKIAGTAPNIGDWIEIEPRYKGGGLQPYKMRNLVTGGVTRVPLGWRTHFN